MRPEGALLSTDELFPGVAQARMAYRMMGTDDAPVAEWEYGVGVRARHRHCKV